MPISDFELKVNQKEKLYDLLLLEKLNKGQEVIGLKEQISRAKDPMKIEDISYVEKQILQN